ncbi:hypothetical protein LEP1GSC192_3130 [Leptospira sp. B5-022]|nr:hypothetical protein LEP1GSC192_3130 [Leptospira sp. B5-022]
MIMQVRFVGSMSRLWNNFARSITETTFPRRLITPLMNLDVLGTLVGSRNSKISLTLRISTPNSS